MSKDDDAWIGFHVPKTRKDKLDCVHLESECYNDRVLTMYVEPYGTERHLVVKEYFDAGIREHCKEIIRVDEMDGISLMAMLMELYPENARAIIEKQKRDSA